MKSDIERMEECLNCKKLATCNLEDGECEDDNRSCKYYECIDTDKVFIWLSCIPDIPENVWGKEYYSTCRCGGTITAVRSTFNGHIRAKCDKCKNRMMA